MAGFSISIDDSQVKALMRKWTPEQVQRRSVRAMNESLAYLRMLIVESAPVGVTGHLRGSVFTSIRGKPTDLRGIVASPLEYAIIVERGRKPGRFPPRAPIELWARRVLGDASLWFVVARAIARRGIAGKHIFEQAAQKGEGTVKRIWRKHFSA